MIGPGAYDVSARYGIIVAANIGTVDAIATDLAGLPLVVEPIERARIALQHIGDRLPVEQLLELRHACGFGAHARSLHQAGIESGKRSWAVFMVSLASAGSGGSSVGGSPPPAPATGPTYSSLMPASTSAKSWPSW